MEGKGWTDAEELQLGDDIRKADGSTGEVEFIEFEQTQQEMYNLTVDEAHTFFVGDGQWLVHNANVCPPGFLSTVAELGPGAGFNVANMAETWPRKYIYGIDNYEKAAYGISDYTDWDRLFKMNTAQYSNVELLMDDYSSLLRSGQWQFDEIIALAPGPHPLLDANALIAATYGIKPQGRILIGSTIDTFSRPSYLEQIVKPSLDILSNRGLDVFEGPKTYGAKSLSFISQLWGAPMGTTFDINSWIYLTVR